MRDTHLKSATSSAAADEAFDVLTTAEEAWPAFERAVLNAEREVLAGFRIFDLATELYSPEAREVGETWFDLLAHVVARGVSFHLVLSDFDPVFGTNEHESTWRTMRQAAALAEVTGAPRSRLSIVADLHPARAGLLARGAFMPGALLYQYRRRKALSKDRLQRQAIGLNTRDLPGFATVSHHQKLAVIDGEALYIGGLDLNMRRRDTLDHDRPAEQTWSDVQVMVRGPEAAEARTHLLGFQEAIRTGEAPEPLTHISRTLSTPRKVQFPFLSPRILLNEIEEDHLRAIKDARHLIHIETQYMRATPIAEALAEAAGRRPELGLIMVLPALPDEVAFYDFGLESRYGMALQTRALETIRDGFGTRAAILSPVQPRYVTRESRRSLHGAPIIHVHNKVLVTDAEYGLVGSANLNGRSLHWDTEAAVRLTDPARVARLRTALGAHWWFDPVPEEGAAIETAAEWWRAEAARNAVRRPSARTGFLVPHDVDALEDDRQPLPVVTEDIV
ncbi:phospholipase D family protein [Pseudaestuariivita sp.]|uniref:phospholipase D family protein n=1 Tax=Pseudaestuariivita sp. TaxID=2211669 RepID=UPI004059B92B